MRGSLREKIISSPDMVYYTKRYQYFVGVDGFFYRCERSYLDTLECKIERVSDDVLDRFHVRYPNPLKLKR